MEVEGPADIAACFTERLRRDAPPLSRIRDIRIDKLKPCGYKDFEIIISPENIPGLADSIYISPDVAICCDCAKEFSDPQNRRYHYPFINCTNCGPRFTIVTGIPYDRRNTTMEDFRMCPECGREYSNPGDRRYHAQPVSCKDCGPELFVADRSGRNVDTPDPAAFVRRRICDGGIVAIKGLGGYHLACDAQNSSAVERLRERKARDDKPFALMARDMGVIRKYCDVSVEEAAMLSSPAHPIVLLGRKRRNICGEPDIAASGAISNLPGRIASGNPYLGMMLPYTPVHMLMFVDTLELLVMTSGNRSNEPICCKNDEALENLKDIADFFLSNDRDIRIRTDDSVTRIFRGHEYLIRRSRGYVPAPITWESCPVKDIPFVLACGGELKNTFCINRGTDMYVSHHIGDLENVETLESFEDGIAHFESILDIKPDIAAYDLHPDYLSTKYAVSGNFIKTIAVQHHHAHMASCMADNNLSGEVIGVIFDGSGYGTDGNLWGGEFLVGGYKGYERVGHLDYMRMPGGEAAVREPWRMAASCLLQYGLEGGPAWDALVHAVGAKAVDAVAAMVRSGINSPLTSGAGRLFDAVSALLGIRSKATYEGQAAMELEYAATVGAAVESFRDIGSFGFDIWENGSQFVISPATIFKDIIDRLYGGTRRNNNKSADSGNAYKVRKETACMFHDTMARIVLEGCKKSRAVSGLKQVVLSGGAFQNMILLDRSIQMLFYEGFAVYLHSRVPANDGGLSLGQAAVAIARHCE